MEQEGEGKEEGNVIHFFFAALFSEMSGSK